MSQTKIQGSFLTDNTVGGDKLADTLTVSSNTTINSANLVISSSNTQVTSTNTVFTNNVLFNGATTITGNTTITGATTFSGNTTITGAAAVSGDFTVDTSTLKVDSTNNFVGIGQSSPATPLHINGLPGTTTLRLDAGGTLAGARRNWGISAEKYAAGALTIEYGSTEGAAPTNNAMTIDSSGNVLVGYTSTNGAYKLQVNSQIFATSATIATSDGNYKENVTPLDGVLSLVSQLNPVQFDWKEHPVHEFDRNQPTIGFIAQEVQQVLAEQPYLNSIVKSNECVLEPEETDDEGNVIKEAVTEPFLGIAEGNMVALLTAAIKEQQATITALEARIAALENA